MPFLAEKITGMLYHILKNCSTAELKEKGDDHEAKQIIEEATSEE
jgi:hypothetical protein